MDKASSLLQPSIRHTGSSPRSSFAAGVTWTQGFGAARMDRASSLLLPLSRHAGSSPVSPNACSMRSRFSGPVDTRSHTVAWPGAGESGKKPPKNAMPKM